jgi:putative tryptophan/tyrosine transport system substrate-binding protein
MRRREFFGVLGGAAAAWPLAARAQQAERMRRIGVLMTQPPGDTEGQARVAAFVQGMQKLGWTEGRNVRIDIRWGARGDENRRRYTAELVALAPDVILSSTTTTTMALQEATRTVPIVFAATLDPVGSGIVESLARPGGNATGFMQFEYSLSGKWLELLKQIAPSVTRVGVFREPNVTTGIGQFAVLQSVAPSLGVEVIPLNLRDAAEIERAAAAFVRSPNGGLIVTGGASAIHREQIITLAARHRLPAVYPYRFFVTGGGLISYGPDLLDQFRRAATYTDRVLKGDKPADLPVQAPTKYETVLNLKTAKALGLTVPATVLARADEVIE